MKMNTVYWKSNPEWYDYDENDEQYLTEKAPPETHESFERCKKKLEKSIKDNILYD